MTAAEPCVFIVDDDSAAVESVAALVESMGVPAETFTSVETFLSSYDPQRRGCVVSDLRMRGLSGLELLEKLRGRGSELPVIIISAYADVPVTVRAFQSGAMTLLQKPCRDQELWEAIRNALACEAQNHALTRNRQEVLARLETLTRDERQVLQLVMAGVPNKSVATRLDIGLRTVEARRHGIMTKMQVGTLVELARLLTENKVEI